MPNPFLLNYNATNVYVYDFHCMAKTITVWLASHHFEFHPYILIAGCVRLVFRVESVACAALFCRIGALYMLRDRDRDDFYCIFIWCAAGGCGGSALWRSRWSQRNITQTHRLQGRQFTCTIANIEHEHTTIAHPCGCVIAAQNRESCILSRLIRQIYRQNQIYTRFLLAAKRIPRGIDGYAISDAQWCKITETLRQYSSTTRVCDTYPCHNALSVHHFALHHPPHVRERERDNAHSESRARSQTEPLFLRACWHAVCFVLVHLLIRLYTSGQ